MILKEDGNGRINFHYTGYYNENHTIEKQICFIWNFSHTIKELEGLIIKDIMHYTGCNKEAITNVKIHTMVGNFRK